MNDKLSFFQPWDDEEITKKLVLSPEEAELIFGDLTKCNHIWKLYMGLNEKFQFCEICDEKRPIK